MLRDMSQYYQYALNLLARLNDLENSIGYESLMNFLQEFKRTNNSMALQTNTGLRYASFDNMESVFNRAERYLKKEGSQSEQIGFAKYWELPEPQKETRVDFFDNNNEIDSDFSLFSELSTHIGLGYNAAFSTDAISLKGDANIAYVRTNNLSRVDIFINNTTISDFIQMLENGVYPSLDLINFKGMVSIMVYYQINKAEFVTKLSELSDFKVISTKFRDFSANDGFFTNEAYLELRRKMEKLEQALSPYGFMNLDQSEIDAALGDGEEGSYRRRMIMAGAIDADEEISINIVGITIKSYYNNLGQESENYEQYRE